MTLGINRIGSASDQPEPIATQTHTVQSGQTLQSIANQYQLSADSLASHNGIDVNSSLQAGQNLSIPSNPVSPSGSTEPGLPSEKTGAGVDQLEQFDQGLGSFPDFNGFQNNGPQTVGPGVAQDGGDSSGVSSVDARGNIVVGGTFGQVNTGGTTSGGTTGTVQGGSTYGVSAGGDLNVNTDKGSAHVDGYASAGVSGSYTGSFEATGNVDGHDVDVSGTGKAEYTAGADAKGSLDVTVNSEGADLKGEGEAFAGAKATLSGEVDVNVDGQQLGDVKASATGEAGIGASGSFDIGYTDGQFHASASGSASVGVGGGFSFGFGVNVGAAADAVAGFAKDVANTVGNALGDAAQAAGDFLNDVGSAIGDAADGVASAAGEAADAIGEFVNDIFGGDSKSAEGAGNTGGTDGGGSGGDGVDGAGGSGGGDGGGDGGGTDGVEGGSGGDGGYTDPDAPSGSSGGSAGFSDGDGSDGIPASWGAVHGSWGASVSDSDGGDGGDDGGGASGGGGTTPLGSTHIGDSAGISPAYTAPAAPTGDYGDILNPKANVGFVSFVGSFSAFSSGATAA